MGVTLSGSQGLSSPQANGYVGDVMIPPKKFMKVAAFGVHAVNFLMLLQRLSPAIIRFLIQEFRGGLLGILYSIVTTSRYVVPTGRVKVPAGRYVVPTGKDNVIVSAGRSKVIPAGRTILVLEMIILISLASLRLEDLSKAGPTPKDFTNPVKAISLPQDVSSTFDHRLIELKNQVQCLMEAHLALIQPTQSSLAEQNRNPSSPKHVHFGNLIVILNKEDEAKEEENVKVSTTEYEDHKVTVESNDEFEEETEDEIKEEEEDSPKHFDTFPTMKELRVKGLKVFVKNFTYKCDFLVLEDTTSVIDHDLGSVIFEKPFVEATGLVYDREEGTITF
ncbi:hypothetical protein Tco_1503507 [Tanacetum coccineum]